MAKLDMTTRLGVGGRVVIPSEFRRQLGIQEGDHLIVTLEASGLKIMTVQQAVRRAQRLVKHYAGSRRKLSRELIDERRREASRG